MGTLLSRPSAADPKPPLSSDAPGTSHNLSKRERPTSVLDDAAQKHSRKRPRREGARTEAQCAQKPRVDSRDLEVPVLSSHIIRSIRGEDGVLSLDTRGVPLYEDGFIKSLAGSHRVVCADTEPEASEKNSTVRAVGVPRQAPAGHVDQVNFLGGELRKALRKRLVPVPRTDAVMREFEKGKLSEVMERNVAEVSKNVGALGEREPRKVNMRGKIFLAPLTTNGNLPFRIINKSLGVDITCGEMALAEKLLQGHNSEWALLRRHRSEDVFGVQLCGNNEAVVARAAEVVSRECEVDFIDLNAGCPIDLVFKRGAGCSLMGRTSKFTRMVTAMSAVVDVPLSVKIRMGVDPSRLNAHDLIPRLAGCGAAWMTVHGRTRAQRYSRAADWNYIESSCAAAARQAGIPLVGNGDIYTWRDAAPYMEGGDRTDVGIDAVMLARGSLIKPWLATEIKERRDWDISSSERLSLYKDFCHHGLDHWGADKRGVETTRRFLLEWLSFAYRYVPVGLLETGFTDITMAHRAPYLRGRNDLETLFASHQSTDWVRISEMLLGPTPPGFTFQARHKSNAWGSDVALNG